MKKNCARKVVAVAAACTIALGATACGGTTTTTTSADTEQAATTEQQEENSTEDLAIGTTVNFANGLSVTVDSVEPGLTNYDGSTVTGVHVTYVNNGDEGADYNLYDWKGEDANGAQQSTTFYSEATDELGSGTLANGGTVSGNLYFDGDITSALYFENMFNKTASANWFLS